MEPIFSNKDLRAVIALEATRNFSQAAQRMHLSQSALSSLIGRMEEQLGVRLFERSTRAVHLTDAGQIFVRHAEELVRDHQLAVQAVRDIAELRKGRVAIAALPSLAASPLPALLARFRQQHPGIRLALIEALSRDAFDLVRDGKVDLALCAAAPQQEDLRYEPLTRDQFVLVCHPGHPLAKQQATPIAFRECLAYPQISMRANASVRQYVNAAAEQQALSFTPDFEVDHIATIGALVAHGLGVSLLPESALPLLGPVALTRRALSSPGIARPLGIVTRRLTPATTPASAMQELIRTAFQLAAPQ